MNAVACAVCLENYRKTDFIVDAPCGHVFHRSCLAQWLQRKSSCPECRQYLTFSQAKRLNFNFSSNQSLPESREYFPQRADERQHQVNVLQRENYDLKQRELKLIKYVWLAKLQGLTMHANVMREANKLRNRLADQEFLFAVQAKALKANVVKLTAEKREILTSTVRLEEALATVRQLLEDAVGGERKVKLKKILPRRRENKENEAAGRMTRARLLNLQRERPLTDSTNKKKNPRLGEKMLH